MEKQVNDYSRGNKFIDGTLTQIRGGNSDAGSNPAVLSYLSNTEDRHEVKAKP